MQELKFIKQPDPGPSACCGPSTDAAKQPVKAAVCGCNPEQQPGLQGRAQAAWISGSMDTEAGPVPVVSTEISRTDFWEHVRCRTSAFRNSYVITAGLYAVGLPSADSDVFVSANYKLSFDALRQALKGLDAWVLVLDTRGINVWCAAGKGTFGTEELIQRLIATKLENVVSHKRLIVPQLGAPGISAHLVKRNTGFRVSYGPVRAEDIRAYVEAGHRATPQMRTIAFPVIDRLILTPMEINPAMKKYYPWFGLIILAVFGLQPQGLLFRDALTGGLPFLLLGLVSIFSGALVTPILLPFIPFRSFAVKGWIAGLLLVFLAVTMHVVKIPQETSLILFSYLFFPLLSSYVALQFTGSTTFTGMSGVKKELRLSVPVYVAGGIASIILLVAHKLTQWRIV